MRRHQLSRPVVVAVLATSMAACTRGCVGEVEQAFCDAVERNDAAAAKAIFDAGEMNMLARNLSQTCEPGRALLDKATPETPEFTAMAVAFVKRDGIANTCWTTPGSSGSRSSGGTTCAIHLAVDNRNVAVVQALVESGVSVTDDFAFRAIYDASNQGQVDILRLLVEKGGDPSIGLGVAVESRQTAVIEYLESKGAREDGPPLLMAARRGDVGAVDAAIRGRADLDVVDSRGRTPLHRAALYGQVGVVTRLAKAGANLEVMTPETFWTAMHFAANENQPAVIRALAAAKANVEARKDAGYGTPLMGRFSIRPRTPSRRCLPRARIRTPGPTATRRRFAALRSTAISRCRRRCWRPAPASTRRMAQDGSRRCTP